MTNSREFWNAEISNLLRVEGSGFDLERYLGSPSDAEKGNEAEGRFEPR